MIGWSGVVDILNEPAVRWPLTVLYLLVLGLISIYGLHRYWLVWMYSRYRTRMPRPASRYQQLPRVTIQLPMFNEAQVAQRVIDAAVAVEYPASLLQVQVLDDSTDHSAKVARERVAYWAGRGVDIQYLHRTDRVGFKAGALEAGSKHATGELIAIFDADFIPPRNFLRRSVHYFTDPGIGMVQARWGHLNRTNSMLTRSQAVFLDGHFVIEHTARNRAGRWINFNGTAGIWRKTAIETAGGWQHDTLTEDVDLSYRAQLKGWRFIYLPRLVCPAELPPEIIAFKSQQHRWTKGSIQTAKKLLPTLLRSKASLGVKIEAFFHLTSPMVYLYMCAMVLLFFPAIYVNLHPAERGTMAGVILGVSLFALGTLSASFFYIASQRAQHRGMLSTLAQIPMLMSIGIGIACNNARACLEALVGHESPFIRTPKYNVTEDSTPAADRARMPTLTGGAATLRLLPALSSKLAMSAVEIAMGLYTLMCIVLSLNSGGDSIVSVPFLMLFAAGYLYVGLTSMSQLVSGPRCEPALALQPS